MNGNCLLKLDSHAHFNLARVKCADGSAKVGVRGLEARIADCEVTRERQVVSGAVNAAKEQVGSVEKIEEFTENFEFCAFLADKPRNVEVLGGTEIHIGKARTAEGVAPGITFPWP